MKINLAKNLKFKRYSKFRKADLIDYIITSLPRSRPEIIFTDRSERTPARPLLDDPIPNITVPVLKPEAVTVKPSSSKDVAKAVEKSINTISKWIDWLKESGKM